MTAKEKNKKLTKDKIQQTIANNNKLSSVPKSLLNHSN